MFFSKTNIFFLVTISIFSFNNLIRAQNCSSCTITINSNQNNNIGNINNGQTLCITNNANFGGNFSLNGGTLCIESGATVSGNNWNFNSGTINNYGTITRNNNLNINNGVFNNFGTLSLNNSSTLNLNSNSNFVNHTNGVISANNFNINSAFTNNGSLNISNTTNLNSNGSFTNNGDFTTGTFNINNPFTNNGTVNTNNTTLNSGGSINNSDPSSVFNVTNNMTVNSTINNQGVFNINNLTINSSGTLNNVGCTHVDNNFTNFGTVNGNTINDPGCVVPLSVTLTRFDAIQTDNTITIRWTTSSETNSYYFQIFKLDESGNTLSESERIMAAGFSNSLLNYQWIDENPEDGMNYYKLVETDLNGYLHIYEVISVKFESKSNLKIFPNPTTDFVNIQLGDYQIKSFTILDSSGRIVKSIPAQNFDPHNLVSINVSDLKTGYYFLRFEQNFYVETFKLVIR